MLTPDSCFHLSETHTLLFSRGLAPCKRSKFSWCWKVFWRCNDYPDAPKRRNKYLHPSVTLLYVKGFNIFFRDGNSSEITTTYSRSCVWMTVDFSGTSVYPGPSSKICCPALGDESASGTTTTDDRSEASPKPDTRHSSSAEPAASSPRPIRVRHPDFG
ncbi:hypothetical protein AMECASPLE_029975 [Ameca splendens]|uniref:Uncharacterized protein n=1 Tax=Ameca splendens TaxID=208324 RepID=A0ABV0XVD5_9TELE